MWWIEIIIIIIISVVLGWLHKEVKPRVRSQAFVWLAGKGDQELLWWLAEVFLMLHLNSNKPTYLSMIILILGRADKQNQKQKQKQKLNSPILFLLGLSLWIDVYVFVYMVFVVFMYDLVRRWTDWHLPLGKWTRKVSCQWENQSCFDIQ